jgi:hypothetical protein
MRGYRTYITAGAMIIYATVVLGLDNGNWAEAIPMILSALALIGIRAGIKNEIRNL